VILKKDSAGVIDPDAVQSASPAHRQTRADQREAIVAGLSVSVVNVTYNAMTNRHDYPNSADGTYKALAVI